jgi:hypothetical protein
VSNCKQSPAVGVLVFKKPKSLTVYYTWARMVLAKWADVSPVSGK